jgi:hypothetical protein
VPGFIFSEDFMFQDRSGLLFIDYQHWFPGLGNLVFAVKRAAGLVGSQASCDGWFFRGFSQYLVLNELRGEEVVLKSRQRTLALAGALIVAIAGGVWWVAGDSLSQLFA